MSEFIEAKLKSGKALMIPKPIEKACENCIFHAERFGAYECRINPPTMETYENRPWPAVRANDWCSAFSTT